MTTQELLWERILEWMEALQEISQEYKIPLESVKLCYTANTAQLIWRQQDSLLTKKRQQEKILACIMNYFSEFGIEVEMLNYHDTVLDIHFSVARLNRCAEVSFSLKGNTTSVSLRSVFM
jgi:hypothetical protein